MTIAARAALFSAAGSGTEPAEYEVSVSPPTHLA